MTDPSTPSPTTRPRPRWRIADDVVWQVSLDALHVHALLAPDGEVLVFANTAAAIWQAVADGLDPVEVLQQQVARDAHSAGVDPATIEAGTLDFLNDLAIVGMVEVVVSEGKVGP